MVLLIVVSRLYVISYIWAPDEARSLAAHTFFIANYI